MAAARESEAAGAGGAQLAATAAASTTGDPKHTDSFVHMRPDGPDGAGLEPCGLVTPETCIEGTSGTDTYAEFFVSKQNPGFRAGCWSCTPCKELLKDYPSDEVCFIVSGKVRITPKLPRSTTAGSAGEGGDLVDGETREYGPGGAFVIRKGSTIIWETVETVTKYYVELSQGESAPAADTADATGAGTAATDSDDGSAAKL